MCGDLEFIIDVRDRIKPSEYRYLRSAVLPVDGLYEGQFGKPVNPEKVMAVLASIREEGLREPIVVRRNSKSRGRGSVTRHWEIVDGRLRHAACVKLKFTEVPCVIVPQVELAELATSGIEIADTRRTLDQDAVDAIASSIDALGLLSPLCVQAIADPAGEEGDREEETYRLVMGAHRLAAVKKLGWHSVLCKIFGPGMPVQTIELMEISENLHRSDLSALQKAEQLARWVKLRTLVEGDVSARVAQKAPVGRPKGGASDAARKHNVSRDKISRSLQIADKMSPEAKRAVVAAGLGNNSSVMLKTAKLEPENQVSYIKEVAAARDGKASADPAEPTFPKPKPQSSPMPTLTPVSDEDEDWGADILERYSAADLPAMLSRLEHYQLKGVAAVVRRGVS